MKTKFDIYQTITDKITSMLESGTIPWRKPWAGASAWAVSYDSRKPYSLLNQLMLDEGEYITFKKLTELGGTVKKGAKSQMVVFWKWLDFPKKDANGNPVLGRDGEPEIESIPFLRYYNVFNVNDCEGITPHEQPKKVVVDPIAEGEKVITDYVGREEGLAFINNHPSDKAYYAPFADKVVVPMLNQFCSPNAYYATAFHELTHSTMKASRCDREADNKMAAFGSEDYSKEELVAELGAAYLMGQCGIETPDTTKNNAAYIQSWLKALKNDKKMIVSAAGKAEYAAKYILTGERRAAQA